MHRLLPAILALLGLSLSVPLGAGEAPAIVAGAEVDYEELRDLTGATIQVETIHRTSRSGVLLRYTIPAITVQLPAEAGGFDLSIPRETVRRVRILGLAGDAGQPDSERAEEN